MKPTRLLLALGLAALVLAGCSSSGGSSDGGTDATTTTAAEATTTTAAVTTTEPSDDSTTTEGDGSAAAGPSYDDAVRVYLAQTDDATKASCESDREDKDINVSSGTYTKLTCGGIARFEYIEGADNYDENWPTISTEEVYRSVFHIPGELIVVPVGSNDDFAPNLAADCSCGEVVEQQG